MATPQSGQPVQLGSNNQLAMVQQLLSTLFGSPAQTTTISPGNIAPLQQLMTQLQGADYQGLLQQIFQQASGSIPGLSQAYSNAVGARTGGNSAIAGNLERLMMETTLAAQKQMVDAQLQNQQIQANVGGNIAQATRGTTQTQRTKGQGAELAGLVGLAQAALKLTGSKDLGELFKKMGGGSGAPSAGGSMPVSNGAPVMPTLSQGAQPISSAVAPTNPANYDAFSAFLTGGSVPGAGPNPFAGPGMGSMDWTGGRQLSPDFSNFSDMFASEANAYSDATGMDPLDALIGVTNGFGTGGGFDFEPTIDSYYGY